MKKHLTLASLFLFPFLATAQAEEKTDLIQSAGPFSSEGTVVIEEKAGRSLPGKSIEKLKIESGVLNGIPYRFFYTDGSGTFVGTEGNQGTFKDPQGSNWSVACDKDKMTDSKSCYMYKKDLWVFVYPKGKMAVSIGSNHFPGSTVAIRVDGGKAVEVSAKTGFPTTVSSKLIEQLKSGKSVTTRYTRWPQRAFVDQDMTTHGFAETLQYLQWAITQIK